MQSCKVAFLKCTFQGVTERTTLQVQTIKSLYRKCIYLKIQLYNFTPKTTTPDRVFAGFYKVVFFYNFIPTFCNFTTLPIIL